VSAVEVYGLSKVYQRTRVVDDVTFRLGDGTITGLLGANGAGKSTTLRMLVGLTRPTAGRVTFFGRPYADLPNPARLVGSMLDASANHGGRTGREILLLHATVLGLRDVDPEQHLERVGLAGSGARRLGQYSLGMKQRLGLAVALLGEPRVLILDEPANGLDPQGVVWIRDFLREFADGGGTVLLSSHLLREVEMLADSVLVMAGGRKVADMTADEVAGLGAVRVAAADAVGLEQALRVSGLAYQPAAGGAFLVSAAPDDVGLVAARHGIALRELGVSRQGALESMFFSLTDQEETDVATGR
jgi:ABC-2 type transport system ATP-binding protein